MGNPLRKYLPQVVLEHLARVFILRVVEEWMISAIPKKSRVLIEGLRLPIMLNIGG